jgi:hypothetical protein
MKQEALLKQEALMNWGWKPLKDKIVFRWGRLADDNGKRVELNDAKTSRDGRSGDAQVSPFRGDDHGKRSDFSLHIGC